MTCPTCQALTEQRTKDAERIKALIAEVRDLRRLVEVTVTPLPTQRTEEPV